MPMLAEQYDYVIGGDPDRDTVDLAVLDTATAGVRAHLTQPADAAGYERMLSWAQHHAPGARVWALEGTGNYGAGLVGVLAEAGEDVVEIDCAPRGRLYPANCRSIPASVGCGRRFVSCSPPGTRCWSAARRQSTS